jgi:hypothetical protein
MDNATRVYQYLKENEPKRFSVTQLNNCFTDISHTSIHRALKQLRYRGMACMEMKDRTTMWYYDKKAEDFYNKYTV